MLFLGAVFFSLGKAQKTELCLSIMSIFVTLHKGKKTSLKVIVIFIPFLHTFKRKKTLVKWVKS